MQITLVVDGLVLISKTADRDLVDAIFSFFASPKPDGTARVAWAIVIDEKAEKLLSAFGMKAAVDAVSGS